MNNLSRNQSHENIMTCIYVGLTYSNINEPLDIISIMESIYNCDYEEIDIFDREIIVKTFINFDSIVETITPFLRKWKFSRLSKITQAILLASYTHYKIVGGVDKAVVIDVAIKLAKKYDIKDIHRFINAILDNVL